MLQNDLTKSFELKTERVFRDWSIAETKFTIPYDGVYEVVLVGGGGGGCELTTIAGTLQGGGGACFQGLVKLNQSTEYAIAIGAGGKYGISDGQNGGDTYLNLNGNRLITAGGGARGGSTAVSSGRGKGGTISVNRDLVEVLTTKIEQNGNDSPSHNTAGEGLYTEYNESGELKYCGNGGSGYEYGETGFALITYIYIEEQ